MDLVILVPIAGIAAVLFAFWLAWDVLRRDTGTKEMQDVAALIFEGAMAFLRRQYSTIAVIALVASVVIGGVVYGVTEGVREIVEVDGQVTYGEVVVSRGEEALLTAIAFLVGAAASALAGYIGMYISVRSNLRTAAAAQRSLKEAITVALRGGAVSGFLVVALSLLGVSGIFAIYSNVLGNPPEIAPFLIVGFGFGASFVALFALCA
jgi:K(+)-stimulated pyrophosphate-energized sodium pump